MDINQAVTERVKATLGQMALDIISRDVSLEQANAIIAQQAARIAELEEKTNAGLHGSATVL